MFKFIFEKLVRNIKTFGSCRTRSVVEHLPSAHWIQLQAPQKMKQNKTPQKQSEKY